MDNQEMGNQKEWEEHHHEAIVHDHAHYHVTHNFNERTGSFEHLSSRHSHPHDHGEISHVHWPHENFEHEHLGEAHVHDHEDAVRKRTTRKAKATAPKKTTVKTTKAK